MVLGKPADLRLTTEEGNKLKLDSMGLSVGDSTLELDCPRCGRNKSFSVYRKDDGLLYNCFKAACGVKGKMPSTGTYEGKPAPVIVKQKFDPFPYKGKLEDIPRDVENTIYCKWEIEPQEYQRFGWKYDPHTHRILMPVTNYFRHQLGWVAKKLPKSKYGGKKSIRYMEKDDGLNLHFSNSKLIPANLSDTLVIVEDIISAEKVGLAVHACALLGTSMNNKQAAFIATHYSRVVFMLDPDATTKALEMSKKYQGMFDKCMVYNLGKDPKDTSFDVLEDKLIQLI